MWRGSEGFVDIRWHRDKHVDTDDVWRHPTDAEGWKHFDCEFPDFSSDLRNVLLGLTSYRFNPFGHMSTLYSMWPVVLFPYNLPPWKCMKETNFCMSLLIPGPKSLGRKIDVYQSLIEELKEMKFLGTLLNIEGKTKDTMNACCFYDLCARTIRVSEFNRLQADITIKLFSYSWMYLIERSLRTLKQYIQNKVHPKGSIVEAYVMNESCTYCSHYLSGIETRFTRDERNDDTIPKDELIDEFEIFKQKVRPLGASSLQTLSQKEKHLFHCYIFKNDFFSLVMGPSIDVRCYNGCIVGELRFHTLERDSRCTTQNNGVMAHQIFYLGDPKNGTNWKVVQVIQNQCIWDVPEVEDVKNEQLKVLEIIVEPDVDEYIEDDTLCRPNVNPTLVERSVVHHVMDDFINDDDKQLSPQSGLSGDE
ncbi:uncharacterized protein E5676_scaffold675G00870 [Cucumis melo var. makuwa]|uniref:DUF4218 domain-containing protein n=1 Tax=Cucumis melo var. makuwa TaxID=1194695 RepID=A0A5A7UBQ3_CUCMM|nr:uncharacterized protein E6C27_scaffold2606G00380 [Cucumis melo var. makuwa]TYK04398.1 uncharacterized protein E5676_scaffold675G00870 [Cucumis melo var. makuwa]